METSVLIKETIIGFWNHFFDENDFTKFCWQFSLSFRNA